MKKQLLAATFIALFTVVLSSCETMQKMESNPYVSAANTFASNCTGCHGVNGTTGKATKLDHITNAAQAALVIANGRGGMPAFKNKLTPAEIDALGQFVAAIGKK